MTKEISTNIPLYINTKNKKIEYRLDCILIPSNILNALINSKKQKIVKTFDIFLIFITLSLKENFKLLNINSPLNFNNKYIRI